ncbi:HupE/UreJ family protein [Paracoccus mutanolyticus]|uniref:HupE/UreJ family protein n=1 Tax=Paracoccus mutanolyticus TaxID=1499308 RepID=UPI0021D52264|nr:HupE/UreJ family protein [Paracoccus mutanolyticus]
MGRRADPDGRDLDRAVGGSPRPFDRGLAPGCTPKALTLASLAAIGLFAACHGHAHATEAHGNALAYMAGFLISTAGLHLVGIGIARRIADGRAARLLQTLSGSGIAAAGLALMAGG